MPTVLVCSGNDLEAELTQTLLRRSGVERQTARRAEDARVLAVAARPELVVVDRDLAGAEALVAGLRQDPATRPASIVIVARGDFQSSEIGLLEAGANAILRLPPSADWDERLDRLLAVPARRDERFPVQFEVEALGRSGPPTPAMGLNLSLHGILIESSVPVAIGDELELVMRLPETAAPLTARGVVVRQAAPTRFGIRFLALEPQADAGIRAFVAARSGRSAAL